MYIPRPAAPNSQPNSEVRTTAQRGQCHIVDRAGGGRGRGRGRERAAWAWAPWRVGSGPVHRGPWAVAPDGGDASSDPSTHGLRELRMDLRPDPAHSHLARCRHVVEADPHALEHPEPRRPLVPRKLPCHHPNGAGIRAVSNLGAAAALIAVLAARCAHGRRATAACSACWAAKAGSPCSAPTSHSRSWPGGAYGMHAHRGGVGIGYG
jgi:hypothetical protein